MALNGDNPKLAAIVWDCMNCSKRGLLAAEVGKVAPREGVLSAEAPPGGKSPAAARSFILSSIDPNGLEEVMVGNCDGAINWAAYIA